MSYAQIHIFRSNFETQGDTFELDEYQHFGTVSDLLELSRRAPALLEKVKIEPKRELIKTVLSNLGLEDKQLRWEYSIPFDMVAE